ncbi:MAG TPA: hypothetical protein VFV99_22895 [Kofleriaceae bacterium]|nr:hypothetical protein [Kofleriaceae bacterium]
MKRFALVALVAGCAGATPVVLTGRAETASFPGRVTMQLAAYSGPSSVCDPSDSANLCSAATVIARVGHILDGVRRVPCSDAARALDRYADLHAHEIATLLHLHELEPAASLARWEDRQRGTAELALVAGFDLVTRCEHDDQLEHAVRRVGLGSLFARSTSR